MQIFIRGLEEELLQLEIDTDDTIFNIREYVAEEYDVDVDDLVLSFHGTPMNNENELNLLVTPGSTIDVTVKVLGGKVHGSLSHTGKVKSQTPKVAPQEDKHKKKTGRAKRRLQYNQRFVNKVHAPFGQHRGPNSNQQQQQPSSSSSS